MTARGFFAIGIVAGKSPDNLLPERRDRWLDPDVRPTREGLAVTCPACECDRDDCHACAGVCHTCHGAGELADNPGWPDPQTERRFICPTCNGDGMLNPDFNNRPETYTETWLRHTREDTAAALFDEAFEEALTRQDFADARGPAPHLHRVSTSTPRNDPSSGGRSVLPSGPATSEDDERKAA